MRFFLSFLCWCNAALWAQGQMLSDSALAAAHIFDDIETALSQADKVYKLDLRGQHLTNLPDGLVKFKNLHILWLSNNLISEFPKNMPPLPYLQLLALDKNNFKNFICMYLWLLDISYYNLCFNIFRL